MACGHFNNFGYKGLFGGKTHSTSTQFSVSWSTGKPLVGFGFRRDKDLQRSSWNVVFMMSSPETTLKWLCGGTWFLKCWVTFCCRHSLYCFQLIQVMKFVHGTVLANLVLPCPQQAKNKQCLSLQWKHSLYSEGGAFQSLMVCVLVLRVNSCSSSCPRVTSGPWELPGSDLVWTGPWSNDSPALLADIWWRHCFVL